MIRVVFDNGGGTHICVMKGRDTIESLYSFTKGDQASKALRSGCFESPAPMTDVSFDAVFSPMGFTNGIYRKIYQTDVSDYAKLWDNEREFYDEEMKEEN
jgi:hypothetical protein